MEIAVESGASAGAEMRYIRKPFILRPERVGLHNWKEVLQTLGERRGNPGWSSVFVPSMVRRGAELGITNMSFDGDVGNSTDSHRLLHWAGLQGWEKQEALANELALSQFTRDECMGDHAVLKACAAEAGLGPVAAVAAVLDDPAKHLDDVVAGIEWAHAQGFYSIPVFLLSVDGGNTVAVDGARSPQEYAAVLADLIQSAGGGNADAGAVTDATTHVDHGN